MPRGRRRPRGPASAAGSRASPAPPPRARRAWPGGRRDPRRLVDPERLAQRGGGLLDRDQVLAPDQVHDLVREPEALDPIEPLAGLEPRGRGVGRERRRARVGEEREAQRLGARRLLGGDVLRQRRLRGEHVGEAAPARVERPDVGADARGLTGHALLAQRDDRRPSIGARLDSRRRRPSIGELGWIPNDVVRRSGSARGCTPRSLAGTDPIGPAPPTPLAERGSAAREIPRKPRSSAAGAAVAVTAGRPDFRRRCAGLIATTRCLYRSPAFRAVVLFRRNPWILVGRRLLVCC